MQNRPIESGVFPVQYSVKGKKTMLTLNRRIELTNRLCYLFVIFLIGCLTGWIYEEIFYWYTEGMLRNRGILYGPWLPIYGVGALGIYAMKPFKKNPAVLFLLSAGITGVVEYIIGWIAIHCFGMHLWDYRGLFGNISGIICVRSVVSFALLGLVFHYLIEPSTERVMGRLSRRAVYGGCSLLAVLLLTDCILSALYRTPITY